ncbi:hypothetical protein AB4582_10575 [Vibrio splendidus]|uniref:hypothetical protein n=1 Tax=Vibrio splendidus TaxID=29497 RepID=UPI002469597F|nr:hypothetical protein [Vibrio splendidus]MDH5902683.1 hypothetical protein [Vibrio splendidus]
MSGDNPIIARMYTEGGGEETPVSLDAYLNNGGLISIAIDDDSWIEISPIEAKKLMGKFEHALGASLAQMLSPTE